MSNLANETQTTETPIEETPVVSIPKTQREIQNTGAMDRMKAIYPNVCQIAQELQNSSSKKHYNPNHPATWDKIALSVNPAGELKKLALAFAIDFPPCMKTWDVSADWASYNSNLIKEIERRAIQVGTNILTLANKHELRPFLHNRCQHILGFQIDYVPLQAMNQDHELVDEDEEIIGLCEDSTVDV
jgi:hypothetical protein